ncbi:MAG TPA: translation initiation factor IF-2 N-terminal domain-containing protein, partial [Mycobacteriales bacterium]|nr:translation initiation factor IF-2 N-terminal domain-containing protein [Mycobacteriales bacterium]
MAKERVSALAKQIGMPSKQLIEWLNNNGEYVKTPSSTVEAPVVAKVFAAFPPVAEAEKPAPKATKKAAAPEVPAAPDVDSASAPVESPMTPAAPLAPAATAAPAAPVVPD